MSHREDDDLVANDLIRKRERKPIEDRHLPIVSALPLGCCCGELKNRREDRFELVFEFVSRTSFVVDLDNGQPMNP